MTAANLRFWVIGASFALVAGCSGGGDGGGPGDTLAPTARINFPPLSSEIEGSEVLVRGTAADSGGVAAVRVNGVAAASSDGFATWEALVPLAPGENQLVVEAEDTAGNVAATAAVATAVRQGGYEIGSFSQNLSPVRLAFDPSSRRLMGFSQPWPGSTDLVAIHVDTGFRERLQTFSVWTHPWPSGATLFGITFDTVRGKVITVGSSLGGAPPVIAVDPTTGSIDTLTPPSIDPRALAYDAVRDRVLVYDFTSASILALDLATLQVSEVSGPNVGSGPAIPTFSWLVATQLVVDTTHDRILFLDRSQNLNDLRLLTIDPATGDRIEALLPWMGALSLGSAWDEMHQRLLVLRGLGIDESELVAIDTTTGTETILAIGLFDQKRPSVGLPLDPATGRAFIRDVVAIEAIDTSTGSVSALSSWREIGSLKPIDATMDRSRGIIYVTARGGHGAPTKIEGFDATTGARVFTWEGASYALQPERLAWDEAGQRLVYRYGGAVVGLDPITGIETVLSSAELAVGAGPSLSSFAFPTAPFALSADGATMWAATNLGSILEVDLATGDRVVIDSSSPSEPTAYDDLLDLIADEARGRLYLGAPDAVISLDLETGNRSIVSGRGVGAGPEIAALRAVGWDEASNRFVVSDGVAGQMLRIEVTTGERTVLRQGYAPRILVPAAADGIMLAGSLFGNEYPGGSALGLLLVDNGDLAILRPPAQL